MTDKERKSLENAGILYPAPNCVDYNQKVQVIAKEMADRIWKAINDKVQVVRCKDCVNRGIEGECPLYESAYITGTVEGSNFYCAWGERREDG